MKWNNQSRDMLKEMIEKTGKDYINICQDLKNTLESAWNILSHNMQNKEDHIIQ